MLKARIGALSIALVAAAGLVYLVDTAAAQGDAAGVKKIADLVKKGDMAGAKKAAAAYAKDHSDLEEAMELFKPAKKKGLGVTGTDQGIEQTLNKIGRDAPTAVNMGKMSDAYAEMGYNVAAIGLITEALAPEKDSGKKTRKAWVEWSGGLVEAGLKLAEASKSKTAADVKTYASKVNANCNSCHSTFK